MENIVCVQGTKKFCTSWVGLLLQPIFSMKKYVFLHTYPTEGDCICSSSVDVDIDFEKRREIVAEALRRGLIKPEDYVIYSPALPHVTFIGLSYPVALLVGLYFFTAFI